MSKHCKLSIIAAVLPHRGHAYQSFNGDFPKLIFQSSSSSHLSYCSSTRVSPSRHCLAQRLKRRFHSQSYGQSPSSSYSSSYSYPLFQLRSCSSLNSEPFRRQFRSSPKCSEPPLLPFVTVGYNVIGFSLSFKSLSANAP